MRYSTSGWLNSAQEDIIVIESVMHNENTTGAASFHAQQCIEKSLKAVLEENRVNIPRIHDLKRIFSLTETYFQEEYDEEIIDKLNTLYIESRYPGAFGLLPYGSPTLEDVKEFYEAAKNIVESVKRYIAVKDSSE